MERRYLTVFILILLTCLFVGIIWNIVLDASNRSRIRETIRTTFDLVKANKAEEFIEMTRLTYSMIYKDYDDEKHLVTREQDVVDLYAELRNAIELTSVSLTKALERTACLARLTLKQPDGSEVVRYMLLVKYQDRGEEKMWAPYGVLSIETDCKKTIEQLRQVVSLDGARRQAQEQAKDALAAPAADIPIRVQQILANFKLSPEAQQEFIEEFGKVVAQADGFELEEHAQALLVAAVARTASSPKLRYARVLELLEKANRSGESVPEVAELAGRMKEVSLDRSRLLPERLNSLAKLARTSLQDVDARSKFASECEEMAGKSDVDLQRFVNGYGELAAMPMQVKSFLIDKIDELIANRFTRTYWSEMLKADFQRELKGWGSNLDLGEVFEGIAADMLDPGDLYEARVNALRDMLQGEKNRRATDGAKIKKRAEALTRSFPQKWSKMESREEYMEWAFPGDTRQRSGLSESEIKWLVERQEKFADTAVGRVFEMANIHHWYPDPEWFDRTDTHRLSVILRTRFQINPDAQKGDEEYEVNDFMLLQEMAPDWSVQWKLHRVCDLYEYDRCFEISQQEIAKRKTYFADGKAR